MDLPLDVYCREIDWPQIPIDICEATIEHVKNSDFLRNQAYHALDNYTYELYDAPQVLIDWCMKNLPEDLTGFVVKVHRLQPPTIEKHKDDAHRISSFNFLLTTDPAVTTWYDEDKTTVKHSTVYTPFKWYQHHGRLWHDITGLKTHRMAVLIYQDLWKPGDFERLSKQLKKDLPSG
jgi:hypothetical protein